ncbi:MAG TPA: hypothetical protein VIQ81_00140, partial [Gammaproteobacteria bacterium]
NPLMMACQHQLSKGIDVIRKCHESKTETVVVLQNNAGYVRANLKPLIQVNEKKCLYTALELRLFTECWKPVAGAYINLHYYFTDEAVLGSILA